TAQFYEGLERVHERRADGRPGWSDDNLDDLRMLAGLPPARDNLPELRSEAAAALGAVGLRHVRDLAPGFPACSVAFSPDGKTLALGGWRPEPGDVLRVKLLDPATGRGVRDLTYPVDREWERVRAKGERSDGCRALAFNPDGTWLVLGTRSGRLVRWDM